MRITATMAVLLAASVGLTGCMVSKTRYNEAVAESEAAKTDLEKTRAMKTALEQQVKTLKDLNGKLSADAELAQAESQRIKESRQKERESVEDRVHELESRNREIAGQFRAVRQEYEELKRAHESLKVTMARYQKELKERPRSLTPPTPPAPPKPHAPPSPGSAGGKPEPTSPAMTPAPSERALAPVNVNTASANDMVLFLGLNKDIAERVVANRPYRLKGELVAKNILPKATFDAIRDKISVGQ
jgi:DNA uptake protein ComE-like DNA-binding protein